MLPLLDRLSSLVCSIVQGLAPERESRVSSASTLDTIVFEIRCHPLDHARLLGQQGRTVKAMQLILSSSCHDDQRRLYINVRSSLPPAGSAAAL